MQDLVFDAVLEGELGVNRYTLSSQVSEEVNSRLEKERQQRMSSQLQQLRLREGGMVRREYENL